MTFRIHALDPNSFTPLFSLSDEALVERGARRVRADEQPGYPCRVSLVDAAPGETLMLVNFEHQPADTPFRATHAIFVREGAERAMLDEDEIPESLASRLLSVRAFDSTHILREADVVDGRKLADCIERLLTADIAYLHVHNAKQGCYAARVERT